jgi:segregation and condensation protein A
MQLLDLNIAGEFLVMAATLMQIKSKMLLPAQENEAQEEETDPRAELVRQLLEYEKFKQVAEELKAKEAEQREVFKRPLSDEVKNELTQKEVYFEASLFDLISAFSKALQEIPKELFYEVIKDEFTIEEKVHQILHSLLEKNYICLSELFSNSQNKIEIIVTFLAILELIKMKEIVAVQKGVFEEIEITRNKENITPYERRNERETN